MAEEFDVEPADDGEHDYLRIEKRDCNTAWLARQLARHAGVAPRDVGYCGLKDRRAVTTQWFSVRRPPGGTDWSEPGLKGVRIVDSCRGRRKLRRGVHAGNRFSIVLRGVSFDARELEPRVADLRARGFPNYFGPQRFGRDGRNLQLARTVLAGRRVPREQRSIALSAGRAAVFNLILAARVDDGTWETPIIGDRLNLDGSNSVFDATTVDSALRERCRKLDVHPCGSLWGRGAPVAGGPAAEIELATVAAHPDLTRIAAGLVNAGIAAGQRALRARVHDLHAEFDDDSVRLDFRLGRGSYATALLQEIVAVADAPADFREPDQRSSSST